MFSNSSPKQKAVYVAIVAITLAFMGYAGSAYLNRSTPIQLSPSSPSPKVLVVHVTGAVKNPGVFQMAPDDRVVDAIRSAGGALGNADLNQLNLAASLEDGSQVFVPVKGSVSSPAVDNEYQGGEASDSASTYQTHPRKKKKSGSRSVRKNLALASISINFASVETLKRLPGVGDSMAEKIVAYRKEHKGFSSVEELLAVKGITVKKLEKIRKYLKL